MRPTVRAELAAATAELAAAGVDSSRVEAELLLSHVLGLSRSRLLITETLSPPEAARLRQLVGRRAAGVPVQHLTGTAPFRRLELAVGPGVFIPRPETELLIELAARWLAPGATVVDLGAGSGAIALSVAREFPVARVIAVERSEQALHWLRRNAVDRQAAGDRPIEVLPGDITDAGLLAELGEVSAVLANPPYVPESCRAQLPAEVAHDPAEAVFAGEDGLALMPAVIGLAGRLLRPGGFLGIEHDQSHAEALAGLLHASGCWTSVAGRSDLTGRPRFTIAVRA